MFTSVVRCDECLGTGVDLSDDRLEMKLESPPVMVRTRKLLHGLGVDTVRQLLCFGVCSDTHGHLTPFVGARSVSIALRGGDVCDAARSRRHLRGNSPGYRAGLCGRAGIRWAGN